MTQVRPASDARAADWLLADQTPWWHLVRYGPPGFEVYVRVSFGHVLHGDWEQHPGARLRPRRADDAGLLHRDARGGVCRDLGRLAR